MAMVATVPPRPELDALRDGISQLEVRAHGIVLTVRETDGGLWLGVVPDEGLALASITNEGGRAGAFSVSVLARPTRTAV